jgi:hypothetical protein
VGSVGIVVESPRLDDPAGGLQAVEQVLIEAFIPEPSVRLSTKAFWTGLPGAM